MVNINIQLNREAKENIDDILEILKEKLELIVCQKDLIPWLVRNPEKAAAMVIENIKRSP